jgi:hypothetical protein
LYKKEWGGATRGETIFTYMYIGKNLLKLNIRPISIKLGTNHFK